MKVIIIGAGFGGLSAAAYLAKAGHDVTVYEKNAAPGGRANTVYQDGFQFELGPSWYLMPDVFDEFFADFDHKTSDFYQLKQLVPSYRVYDQSGEFTAHPRPAASMDFEHLEPGAGSRLARLLDETKKEYELVRRDILPLNGLSTSAYMKNSIMRLMLNPKLTGSYHSRIKKTVSHETLQHVLEFMVVFLGGSPRNIPAMYGLLMHVDFGLGIWYPTGGFTAVAKAVETVAKEQGVHIIYNAPVEKFVAEDNKVVGVMVNGDMQPADGVVANADYHFVDTQLTPPEYRMFSDQSWSRKTLSPSAVLATIGVKKPVNLLHHSLFFDTDWDDNFADVFEEHRVNDKPLFYVCAPSKSDRSVAPEGYENIFILIPVSSKAKIDDAQAEQFAQNAIERIEEKTGDKFRSDIVTRKVYGPEYFQQTFNAFGGNAFGLAHTAAQSGPLRPAMRSSRLSNLYFTGQYTNPGTGVPLVLLSGKVVAKTFDIQ